MNGQCRPGDRKHLLRHGPHAAPRRVRIALVQLAIAVGMVAVYVVLVTRGRVVQEWHW